MDQTKANTDPSINDSRTSDAAQGTMDAVDSGATATDAPSVQSNDEARKVTFEEKFIDPEDEDDEEDEDHGKATTGKETQVSVGGAGEVGVGTKKRKKRKPKSKRGLVGLPEPKSCAWTSTDLRLVRTRLRDSRNTMSMPRSRLLSTTRSKTSTIREHRGSRHRLSSLTASSNLPFRECDCSSLNPVSVTNGPADASRLPSSATPPNAISTPIAGRSSTST